VHGSERKPFMPLRLKAYRSRAARLLVALYALCVLAPAGALAFGDAAYAAHCLTHDHHGVGQAHDHATPVGQIHVHHDGTSHEHSKADDPTGKTPTECCGLFCLTALPAPMADLATLPSFAGALAAAADDRAGREPDILYRPPISLLRS
jgi:hypothetical protein